METHNWEHSYFLRAISLMVRNLMPSNPAQLCSYTYVDEPKSFQLVFSFMFKCFSHIRAPYTKASSTALRRQACNNNVKARRRFYGEETKALFSLYPPTSVWHRILESKSAKALILSQTKGAQCTLEIKGKHINVSLRH